MTLLWCSYQAVASRKKELLSHNSYHEQGWRKGLKYNTQLNKNNYKHFNLDIERRTTLHSGFFILYTFQIPHRNGEKFENISKKNLEIKRHPQIRRIIWGWMKISWFSTSWSASSGAPRRGRQCRVEFQSSQS